MAGAHAGNKNKTLQSQNRTKENDKQINGVENEMTNLGIVPFSKKEIQIHVFFNSTVLLFQIEPV